jgi:nicotinate-nucleotide--dimethylbenzimidazole phosphoribosyltransferase
VTARFELNAVAVAAATELQGRLTKPPGALGQLEAISIQLAGIAGLCPPPVPERVAIGVFAGDHGVVASGVTPWPSEVTAQMVMNFANGGAAINVIARSIGATITVVDVGVATPLDPQLMIEHRNVRRGTADLSVGPAMTADKAAAAMAVGRAVAEELIASGAQMLVTGEMGIGNTTPSAILIGALCGADAAAVTGRGTGIDDEHLARKQAIVAAALARVTAATMVSSPVALLAEVGGLEIAALAGFITAGVEARVPVILDGVIALAAACVAEAIHPGVMNGCIAGHRSTEPAATIALAHLGLTPLIDLGLRLGEGSGAALAVPLVQAAARLIGEMATFDSAGVTDKT